MASPGLPTACGQYTRSCTDIQLRLADAPGVPPRSIQARFADRLRTLRQRAGLAQEELASQAKLSRHYVNEVESGRRNPSLVVIAKLAHGLRVPLRELMDF